MPPTEDQEKASILVRLMFRLPFKKRFSPEEYGELFRLLREGCNVLSVISI